MKEKLNLFIGLIAILLLGYASWKIAITILDQFDKLSDGSKAAILVAFIPLPISAFSIVYGRVKDRQLQIQAQQMEKREVIATDFMRGLWGVMHEELANDEEKMKELLSGIMIKGTLWFSDETLKAFVDWRLLSQTEPTGQDNLDGIATFILALRKDLGHKNKGIKEQDILRVFVNEDINV